MLLKHSDSLDIFKNEEVLTKEDGCAITNPKKESFIYLSIHLINSS